MVLLGRRRLPKPLKALIHDQRGGGLCNQRSAPMHDVYNFIVVDHLDFTIGAGSFVLGWITASLMRRRKLKPAGAETHVALDYYGLD